MKSTHTLAYRRLLDLVVGARKRAAVTQQDLANRLGSRQSFISKVELGERRLDVIEFLELCRAINTDPYALLREIEQDLQGG